MTFALHHKQLIPSINITAGQFPGTAIIGIWDFATGGPGGTNADNCVAYAYARVTIFGQAAVNQRHQGHATMTGIFSRVSGTVGGPSGGQFPDLVAADDAGSPGGGALVLLVSGTQILVQASPFASTGDSATFIGMFDIYLVQP